MFTVAEREAALTRAVELLSEDERVEAAVLTGSLGRGAAGRWSDVDLDAVIASAADPERVAADWEAIAYREWPIAHHYATAFGTTLVLALASERHGFDSEDFVHVDDLPADEVANLQGTPVASLRRDALIEAAERATQAFLDELRRHDGTLAARLSEPLLDLVSASRQRVDGR